MRYTKPRTQRLTHVKHDFPVVNLRVYMYVLFCSLAALDLRVGHTMDVLSPFISVIRVK